MSTKILLSVFNKYVTDSLRNVDCNTSDNVADFETAFDVAFHKFTH